MAAIDGAVAKRMRLISSMTIALGLTAAADAVPEISGIFSVGDTTRFVLVESETGESSRWVTIGQEFGGYRLVSFDSSTQTLTVERDGSVQVVGLKTAVIKELVIVHSGSVRLGSGDGATVQKIVLILDQESAFPLGDGVTVYLKPKRRADGNLEYASRWERVGADGTKELLSAPKVIARPGQGFSIFCDGMEFELKP